jgi:two-component system, NtrC family, sensor kinase
VEGRFLAHTDASVILDTQSIRRRPEMQAALGSPNYQWSGIYTNFQGLQVVGTTAPIPNTNWIILTELPLTEAYATTRTGAIYTLVGFLLVSTIAIVTLARFLERLIFGPISDLRTGAEAIGQGNLGYRVNVIHHDEIGEVAETFNQMAQSLDERNRLLEARTEELAVARDQALEGSRMKSQFLANMSHELRTPLNAILNFAEFVAKGIFGEVNARQLDALEKVIGSGEHLLSLINDILDLTKIESGMMELFIEEVDLAAILGNVVTTGKSLVKDKPVEILEDIDDPLPAMTGDRRRIQQILLNLVSNAAKFTPSGSIKISAHHEDGTVILSIQDTGTGIAPQDKSVIFEPFRQGVAGAKHGAGTGLGLPITKHLAEAHGGKLWVESEIGVGTTFYIRLPVNAMIIDQPSPA